MAGLLRMTKPVPPPPGVTEPEPPTHWLLSFIAFGVSLVPGLVALYFSYRVPIAYGIGDIAAARQASRMARIWGIIGCIVGFVLIVSMLSQSGGSSSS